MNIPFDLSLEELIFVAFLVFISAAVQGVLGFGFAVIASPIIVQINPSLVPQLLSLLGFPLALRVFFREKSKVNWKPLKFLIVGRIIGGPIGLYFLTTLDPEPLSIAVGVIVLSAGLGSDFGWNVKRTPMNSFTAGTFSGMAFSKQPKTTSGSICPIICLAHTAAGYGAFKIEPIGASISKGFREPALFGISALTRQLKPKQV